MFKGKYVGQYTLDFHSIQFNSFVKNSDTRKSGPAGRAVTRKQLKFNPLPIFSPQLTGTEIYKEIVVKMKQYVVH